MCEFCVRHGEGKVWYKNAKNYARQMYTIRKRTTKMKIDPESAASQIIFEAIQTRNVDPHRFPEMQEKVTKLLATAPSNPGQVIPLQDALDVVDIASPIATMSCICRRNQRALDERDEKTRTCLGLGIGMFKWERWPERYKGGVEYITPEECKEWLKKWDDLGMCHVLMVWGLYHDTPYIGGLCNCDYPICGVMRFRLDYGLPTLLKGEYVAQVDHRKCQGCFTCVSRCQFGAIRREVTIDKPNIDQSKCYGCGVCFNGCPRGAISLVRRETIPGLRNVW